MSRARIAASSFQFTSSGSDRVRVRVVDIPKGNVVINAHPDDKDKVEQLYNPKVLDSVFERASEGLVVSSVFTTAFQGICVAALVAGKGPTAATTELLQRVLPSTPKKSMLLAERLRDRVKENLTMLRGGRRPDRLVPSHREGGPESVQSDDGLGDGVPEPFMDDWMF